MVDKSIERGEYVIGIAIILAALLFSAAVYMSLGSLQKAIAAVKITSAGTQQVQQGSGGQNAAGAGASGGAQQGGAQAAAQPGAPNLAPTKEVTIDFLYADWCPHCQKMKPIVAALEKALPKDRFTVRMWRDEDKGTDGMVAAVYNEYSRKSMFSGFPTFIINGADFKAGSMPEAEFKAWICGKFSSPKPSGC
jgi:thiol-disulfide isomerase/thioredoxin